MTSSRHTTTLGTFAVSRPDPNFPGIEIHHVPTGLSVGGFSHLAIKTFKSALAGLNAVEAAMADRKCLDLLTAGHQETLRFLQDLMRSEFPNGAWSR